MVEAVKKRLSDSEATVRAAAIHTFLKVVKLGDPECPKVCEYNKHRHLKQLVQRYYSLIS